ncbi:Uncharacterised protein [uncultured Prevotella sp.]|nr:Uncharacterised protein [uncultured Prevotella sp.]
MQKPPFCTPKTILLHAKNHTFVLRTRNIHRMNTLQTLRKISTSNHEIPNLHPARRRGPIHRARILTLSNPYFPIIKYAYSFHHTRIFILLNMCFRIIAHVCSNHHTRMFAFLNTYIHLIKYVYSFLIMWVHSYMWAR